MAAGIGRCWACYATNVNEQTALKLQAAQQAYAYAKEAFGSWLETRKATNLPDQDRELTARTQALDTLNTARIAADRPRAPEIMQLALNANEHLIEEPLVAGRRRRRFSAFANSRPKRRPHSRIVS